MRCWQNECGGTLGVKASKFKGGGGQRLFFGQRLLLGNVEQALTLAVGLKLSASGQNIPPTRGADGGGITL